MATDNIQAPAPASPPAPAPVRAPVIRLDLYGSGSRREMMRRQLPACIVSIAFHAVLFMAFFTVTTVFDKKPTAAVAREAQELQAVVAEEDKQENFENPDMGLDPHLATNYNIDRKEDVSVAGPLLPDESVGNNQGNNDPQTLPPPPGVGDNSGQGGSIEAAMKGFGADGRPGGMEGPPLQAGMGFKGRSGATREKMLREGGGNGLTEASVS